MFLLHLLFTIIFLFLHSLGLQLLLDLVDLCLLPEPDLLLLLNQILLHILNKSRIDLHNSWILIEYLSLNVPIKGMRNPHHHFFAE